MRGVVHLRRLTLLLLVSSAGWLGCQHAPPASAGPLATVRVDNRSGCRVVMWVARDSAHTRLGYVANGRQAEWPIPRSFVAGRDSVRLLAFRGGDPACAHDTRLPAAGVKRFRVRLPLATDSTFVPGTVCRCGAADRGGSEQDTP